MTVIDGMAQVIEEAIDERALLQAENVLLRKLVEEACSRLESAGERLRECAMFHTAEAVKAEAERIRKEIQ